MMAYSVHKSRRLGMFRAAVSLLLSFSFRTVDTQVPGWNYKSGDNEGPENWYKNYSSCNGVKQSPIDISSNEVTFDSKLELLNFSDYRQTANVAMELNNMQGHTAGVTLSGTPLYLTAGGLPARYRLVQFHFHWGAVGKTGSEHTLNGYHYPMEAHFVHLRSDISSGAGDAPQKIDYAVVAVFFKVGKENPSYKKILDYFVNITSASAEVKIPTFPVKDLLPPSARYDYFRYAGSLTTPPCSEAVIWSVLADLAEISEAHKSRELTLELTRLGKS